MRQHLMCRRTIRTTASSGVMPAAAKTTALAPRVMLAALLLTALALLPPGRAQTQVPLIDVEFYRIHAEIDPLGRSIEALAEVRFVPREAMNLVVFELHTNLNVNGVVTVEGDDVSVDRVREDNQVRLTFPGALVVGNPVTVTFQYEGQLTGVENSPVQGVSLASIDPDRAYLLYPGRWFPVNGYAADRFSSEMHITVPAGYQVVGSGIGTRSESDDKVQYSFTFTQPSFPGSIAVVREKPVRVDYEGINTLLYFKTASADLAEEYGAEVGRIMGFFTEKFGPPYSTTLTVIETGDYAPNAYTAPGIVFLSPFGIGEDVNRLLLGTEVAHQWWRTVISPGNRNHSWLDLGLAKYAAMLEIEENEGETEFIVFLRDTQIDALTYDEIPVLQAGRLPDFSPEIYALAGSKGAMVLNMLRFTMGDEAFFATLKQFAEKHAWSSVITEDLLETAESVSGKSLKSFIIQWTENTGTPEFSQEYTIYRLGGGKGFRVMGKISQDMDTFSMPVEVEVQTEGEPEYEMIEVRGRSSDYVIETFGKPRRVVLDPKSRILRYDESIHVKVAIRKGEQLMELGYYDDALDTYQQALDINRYSSLAHYRIGEIFFRQNNYQSAANQFREALNGDGEPEWTEVWAHISLGNIFDITDQRDRAVNEYQLALRTRDNTQGALGEAQKYLEQPYRRPRRTERVY